MLDVLAASGPHRDHADKLMLFGQFVGAWDFEGFYTAAADDRRRETTGEWHFGWVLDGRAIQDVLICPPVEYGSTLRFYDAEIDAWQITWITPPNRGVVRLVGRPVEDEIVLDGDGAAGRLRWMFRDIAPDSFVWQGYLSRDGGATYVQREEMRLRRRAGG